MSFSTSSLKTLKVSELKDLCSNNSLSSTGKKEDLVARLTEFNEKNIKDIAVSSTEAENSSKAEVSVDIDQIQTPVLDSEPGSESNITSVATVDSKTANGLSVSGIVSSPPSISVNGATKSDQAINGGEKPLKNSSALSDSEKARLRAEKFGTSSDGSSITHPEVNIQDEKNRKRAESSGPSNHHSSKNPPQPKEQIGHQLGSTLTAIASISQEEKLRLRAERFGVDVSSFSKNKSVKPAEAKSTSNEIKSSTSVPVTEEDKLKLDARAKRFKTATSNLKDTLSPLELEKLAKRAERFGLNKS